MPLANEAEIKRIIIKVYKALDDNYLEHTTARSGYYYVTHLIEPSGLKSAIQANLTEQELNTFVLALSQNELEVGRLIAENSDLKKFNKKIKDYNTLPFARCILNHHSSIAETKRARERTAKKQKEKRELYAAARLTPRQKQVLNSLGLQLAPYEKPQ